MAVRVLIVDDLPFMRAALRRALDSRDFEIVGEAADGRAGVRRFVALQPDLVIMDIAMPIMDGLSALSKIVESDPKARVVMCSAMGEDEMIMEAIRRGARDFVVKPFQNERVVSVARRVVGMQNGRPL